MRGVRAVVESMWQSEGRGARVRRSIGRPELRNLDPFLMLDEFEGSRKEGAGFPDHPHRQVTWGYSYFRWWDRDPPPPFDQNYQFIAPKASEGWLHCIAFLWDRTTTCLWWFSGVNRININKNNAFIRGFETVSYLLEGEFTHEDFLGHCGVLKVDKDGVITAEDDEIVEVKTMFLNMMATVTLIGTRIISGRRPPVDDSRARYSPPWNWFPFGFFGIFIRYCPLRDARLGENQGIAALGQLAKVGQIGNNHY